MFLLAVYDPSSEVCETVPNLAKFPGVDQSDHGELLDSRARLLANEATEHLQPVTITDEEIYMADEMTGTSKERET